MRHPAARLHAVHTRALTVDPEPAADRVVLFFDDELAVFIEGLEAHAVRMHDVRPRRTRHQLAKEAYVLALVELDLVLAEQVQALALADLPQTRFDRIRIDRVGEIALESKQHGFIGTVTFFCGANRA